MSLIDAFKTPCTLMEKTRVSDGEGGFVSTWGEAAPFDAAIVRDMSTQARIGEAEGLRSVFTVTVAENVALEFHDVFRRDSDGKMFRVTSSTEDAHTPSAASFQFNQVSAEEWVQGDD